MFCQQPRQSQAMKLRPVGSFAGRVKVWAGWSLPSHRWQPATTISGIEPQSSQGRVLWGRGVAALDISRYLSRETGTGARRSRQASHSSMGKASCSVSCCPVGLPQRWQLMGAFPWSGVPGGCSSSWCPPFRGILVPGAPQRHGQRRRPGLILHRFVGRAG